MCQLDIKTSSFFHAAIVSQQSEGASASRVTPSSPHLSTPSDKQATQPQLRHLASTQSKPWTRPRPALPLTAALTALSYSLSESEFSADGDETEPGSEQAVPALTFTTPGKTVYSSGPLQRTTSLQPVDRTTARETTCADRPCFPGVLCEPAMDGGYRCGRCPVGYTGDGRACRGKELTCLIIMSEPPHGLLLMIPAGLTVQTSVFKPSADTHVAGTWSVLRPTHAAANQDTLESTV